MSDSKQIIHTQTYKYPAWAAGLFDNRLRSLIHQADTLFGAYVKKGDTVVDIGIGGGIFTLGLAQLVGETGTVIAVDYQQTLLDKVRNRAGKQCLTDRIRFHPCTREDIGLEVQADFVLSFWMVHEVPSAENLFRQVYKILRPSGHYFIAEPKLHTSKAGFDSEVSLAQKIGFIVTAKPAVTFSRAAVFSKSAKE